MANINQVFFTCNLLDDSRLSQTLRGDYVLNWTAAITDRRRSQVDGSWDEQTVRVECAMFGQRVKALADRLVKGVKIGVKGKLRSIEVAGDEGRRKNEVSVYVEEIDFL